MGQENTYKCDSCSYSVLTSGGHDVGMRAVTDTYICTSCKEIVDVLVGERGQVYPKDDIPELVNDILEQSEFYSCPDCNSKESLVIWDTEKRPCPKCDGQMEIDPEGGTIMWD